MVNLRVPLGAVLVLCFVACSGCGSAASQTILNTAAEPQPAEAPDEAATERELVVVAEPATAQAAAEGAGAFDTIVFDRMISVRTAALRACYTRAVEAEPSLSTRVSVRLVLLETGLVTDVVAIGDPPNADVTECVRQLVSNFRFQPGADGGPAVLETTIVFDQR